MTTPKDLQLRDSILEAILYSYAADPVLSDNLVLQGGGALHFIYGSPRYSSDLDFVAKDMTAVIADIQESAHKGIDVGDHHINPHIKIKDNRLLFRIAYSIDQHKPCGKVEIIEQESFNHAPTGGKYSPIKVEKPSEIYADKIVASLSRLYRRGSLKGTDLFDFKYINNILHAEASKEEVEQKAASYGEEFLLTPDMFAQVISYIENPANHNSFRKQLHKTLLPDVFASKNLDEQYFKDAAVHFKKYL